MITSKVYNQKGKEVGSVNLPEHVFGIPWNADLIHQVVTSMKTNARVPYAHTKTRGEVRGGGKKPWKQKGLGKARHGSTRSPIWVGGGVAHGPRNDKNFTRKISKKMMAKALYTTLSRKFRDGELLFVDSLEMSTPKTKTAKETLISLGTVKGFESLVYKKTNAAFIALSEVRENTVKSLRNFNNLTIGQLRNINPLDILEKKIIVIENPEKAVEFLDAKLKPEQKILTTSSKKAVVKKPAIKKVSTKVAKK
ncbi:MAG: hypothetical protein RJA61_49 [Candidatus Parcubacteria bacterium]|jgi:large subunit ribosomal protein L4